MDIALTKISVLASECNKKQIFKFLRFKGWNLEELSTALIQDCILQERVAYMKLSVRAR